MPLGVNSIVLLTKSIISIILMTKQIFLCVTGRGLTLKIEVEERNKLNLFCGYSIVFSIV